ncbi:peptidoglycan editing factor PgeF [Celerinatantimonas yamalensis]|uniref:Purine nucleoside phosphorylase n=1 Tax=Celerinatantimonas yamalensis TaxID=559956 RepID=A0ABW9G9W1_9GAMM
MAVNLIELVFPQDVNAVYSDRLGGFSQPPYASYNLGAHVGDNAAFVARNRLDFGRYLPREPCWLNQVHGTDVVDAALAPTNADADGAVTRGRHIPCVIMVADCLPILLADRNGRCVGAAHGGWRGLASGIVAKTVQAMQTPAQEMIAWLGPAIGPRTFQVGAEVREAFVNQLPATEQAFKVDGERYLADIKQLAVLQLNQLGVTQITVHSGCTYSDEERFFSYRRDGQTGRMAAAIWLA